MWVKGCLYSNFTIVFNTYVNLEIRNKYVYTKALRYMYIYMQQIGVYLYGSSPTKLKENVRGDKAVTKPHFK